MLSCFRMFPQNFQYVFTAGKKEENNLYSLLFTKKENNDKQQKTFLFTTVTLIFDVLQNEKLIEGYDNMKKQKQQQLTELYMR